MSPDRAKRLLVVDDERTFANILAEVFADEGFQVDRAYDGEQALRILKSGDPPDIVLSDVMLPKMDGAALVGAARKDYSPSQLPILLLSAGPDPKVDGERVWFIPKPLDLDRLVERVHEIVETRDSGAPGPQAR